nr:hypothetical protein [Evansella caseinilytica]
MRHLPKPLHLFKSSIGVVFSYRACSDEQSYDAFHIELSRRIVIEAVLAEKETSTKQWVEPMHSFQADCEWFSWSQDDDISPLSIGRGQHLGGIGAHRAEPLPF